MPRRIPFARPPVAIPPRDRAKAERDAFYSSARWMRLRDVFLREVPLCEMCEEPATIAHHIIERLARPDLALCRENLMALCSPCHTRHHNGRTTQTGTEAQG